VSVFHVQISVGKGRLIGVLVSCSPEVQF
jgi:hypothetical protein